MVTYDAFEGMALGADLPDLATLLSEARPRWHEYAACRGSDLQWFPQKGEQTAEQRALCAGCRVRDACLASALENHDGGLWGGTSEKERKRLRRRRAA